MKKFILALTSMILALSLAATLPLFRAYGAENETVIYISAADDLSSLAADCVLDTWSYGKKVILKEDIDISSLDIVIPLFAGTFDGRGHTISGFEINDAASTAGLFRIILEGGQVVNLNVEGEVTPSGVAENIGGIAGENRGTIQNCTFKGKVEGARSTGGIAGANTSTGVIEGCSTEGSIDGDHQVGGIAGRNHGIIKDCENAMTVNSKVPTDVSAQDADISLSAEELVDITDAGGICGYSDGRIEGCTNNGDVGYLRSGYNIGGIAGHQATLVSDCTNNGNIYGRKDVGGITGQVDPDTNWYISSAKIDELNERLDMLQGHIDRLVSDTDSEADEVTGDLARLISALSGTEAAAKRLASEAAEWANDSLDALGSISETVTNTLNDLEGILSQAEEISGYFPGTLDEIEQIIRNYESEADLSQAEEIISNIQNASDNISSAMETIRAATEELRAADDTADTDEIFQRIYSSVETIMGRRSDILSGYAELESRLAGLLPEGEDLNDVYRLISDAQSGSSELLPLIDSIGNLINSVTEGRSFHLSPVDSGAGGDLFSSLGVMNSILSELNSDVMYSPLAGDVQNVSDEFFGLVDFLVNALESDDGTKREVIQDISLFEDGREEGTLIGCTNTGRVDAERNAGGICGAVTIEVSTDLEEDLDLSAMLADSAKYLIYALIKDCENSAEISAEKEACGGIAGRMDYGAAIGCTSGGICRTSGDYCGGIAGLSKGTLKDCLALVDISAGNFSGGIAGMGHNIYDCLSMPHFSTKNEFTGSTAGDADGMIYGNYYAGTNTGGWNGFSFEEMTREISYRELLEKSSDADVFKNVTVIFTDEDGERYPVTVPYGNAVAELPLVTDKDGKHWVWDIQDLESITCDRIVTGSYVNALTTIATGEDVPKFLAEGIFDESHKLDVLEYMPEDLPEGIPKDKILDAYTVTIDQLDVDAITLRMREPEEGTLFIADAAGVMTRAEYVRDGSYVVFSTDNGSSFIFVKQDKPVWPYIVIPAAAVVLISVVVLLIVLKKKKAKAG